MAVIFPMCCFDFLNRFGAFKKALNTHFRPQVFWTRIRLLG